MTDQTAERDQYARAIREAVRIRLGTNALRLAEEGRPVSAFLDLLAAAGVAAAWWTTASLTFGTLIAAIGYTRNTIRRSTR